MSTVLIWWVSCVHKSVSVFLSVLGTLTQFTLVLYGTSSGLSSPSTADSSQTADSSCKTYDLNQICTGKCQSKWWWKCAPCQLLVVFTSFPLIVFSCRLELSEWYATILCIHLLVVCVLCTLCTFSCMKHLLHLSKCAVKYTARKMQNSHIFFSEWIMQCSVMWQQCHCLKCISLCNSFVSQAFLLVFHYDHNL